LFGILIRYIGKTWGNLEDDFHEKIISKLKEMFMIRVNYCMKRLAGMTEEEFRDYFRKAYAPLVAKHQTTLDIRRYVQSYSLIPDKLGKFFRDGRLSQDPFDGTATFWWHNRDCMESLFASSEGHAAMQEMIECEREFVDFSRSSIFLSNEVPVINPLPENGIVAIPGSPIIKLIYLVTFTNMGREKCQFWWQNRHAAIVRRYGAALNYLRYIQSHTIDDPLNKALRESRGTLEPYDGVTEVWFNRMVLNYTLNDPDCEAQEAFRVMNDDEPNLNDMSRSTTWFSKEHVVIESGQPIWREDD
jgi:hypothetical protein